MSTSNQKGLKSLLNFGQRIRYQRILTELENYQESYAAYCDRKGKTEDRLCKRVENLLAKTRLELIDSPKYVNKPWRHLHLAKRLSIFYFDESECHGLATQLREEAHKLKQWRAEAVEDIVGKILNSDNTSRPSLTEQQTLLFQATELRDEHYHNVYYKLDVRSRYLLWVLGLLFLAICGTIFSLATTIAPLHFLLTISSLGALGATFSIAYSATTRKVEEKIPDQVLGSFIAVLRTLVGLGGALAAFVILDAGLGVQINGIDPQDSNAFLALAFVAGFSERFIISAVSLIAS